MHYLTVLTLKVRERRAHRVMNWFKVSELLSRFIPRECDCSPNSDPQYCPNCTRPLLPRVKNEDWISRLAPVGILGFCDSDRSTCLWCVLWIGYWHLLLVVMC